MAVIISKKWTGKDGYTHLLFVTGRRVHVWERACAEEAFEHIKAEADLFVCVSVHVHACFLSVCLLFESIGKVLKK